MAMETIINLQSEKSSGNESTSDHSCNSKLIC